MAQHVERSQDWAPVHQVFRRFGKVSTDSADGFHFGCHHATLQPAEAPTPTPDFTSRRFRSPWLDFRAAGRWSAATSLMLGALTWPPEYVTEKQRTFAAVDRRSGRSGWRSFLDARGIMAGVESTENGEGRVCEVFCQARLRRR